MNISLKKLFVLPALVLAVCLSLLALPGTAMADTEMGECGSVTWELDTRAGELLISGGTLDDDLSGWVPEYLRFYVGVVVFDGDVVAGTSLSDEDDSGMFNSFSSLTSLDLSKLNTSNVTNMQYLFDGCSNLTSLDVSGLDTSNVTSMMGMFNGCSSLTSLDLSKLDTSKVTNFARLFYGCSGLTSIDVSSIDTSNFIFGTQDLLTGCSSLNTITFGAKFKFAGGGPGVPTPTSTASGGTSTGKWGKGSEFADTTYTASELQTYGATAGNLAGTWYAQAETVTVTYTIAGTTDTFEETVAKGSEYTLKTHIDGFVKSGCELSSWYNRDAGALAPGSTITVDKDMRFTATWNMLTEYERVEPTCTTAGTEAYWYSVNSKKYYSDDLAQKQIDGPVSIPALGHDAVHHEVKLPTCTEDGNNEYWSCSRCNKYFSDAACTQETTADAVKLAAKGHTLTKTDAVAPTCTEDGAEAYWTCSNCNKMFSDDDAITEISQPESVPAAGHKWDEGVVTKEPTATEKGIKTYTCTVCGDTKIEEIPATGSSDKGDGDKGGTTTTVTKTTTTTSGNATPKTGDTADFAVVLFSVLATLALVSGHVACKKR